MKVELLEKERPVFTRALVEPWRLVCLALGLVLLCIGSHVTPSVDSLYWWCRGFDALSVFRVPNAIYSAPLYFLIGFAMNLNFRQSSECKEPHEAKQQMLNCRNEEISYRSWRVENAHRAEREV